MDDKAKCWILLDKKSGKLYKTTLSETPTRCLNYALSSAHCESLLGSLYSEANPTIDGYWRKDVLSWFEGNPDLVIAPVEIKLL